MTRALWLTASACLVPGAAMAVGLGPLKMSGITDGSGKAFYLTLTNPYPTAERFRARAVSAGDETAQSRVVVFPSDSLVGGGGRRRLLVIVRDLKPGETYSFRVCAGRDPKPEETVYARVCSTLTARRLAARG
ncbi:hypothetical protein ABDK56_00050 [Sphingomonas sp. ASV193]|uniref:hypothetical protein n=1 Tax=Sphingomonas sp. ASV193 TaxID=3144405 RepID=UPI0032E8961A